MGRLRERCLGARTYGEGLHQGHAVPRSAWYGIQTVHKPAIRAHERSRPLAENYQAQLYQRLPAFIAGAGVVRYRAPKEIALHPDLAILLRTVDAFVKTHPDLSDLALGRYARWRLGPPSDAQRKLILTKTLTAEDRAAGRTTIDGIWVGRPWRQQVDVMDSEAFTKGQACDILTRLMYGGLGHWKKRKKELVREAKVAEKNGAAAEKDRVKKERAEEKKAQRAAERERKRLDKMVQKMQKRRKAAAAPRCDGDDR